MDKVKLPIGFTEVCNITAEDSTDEDTINNARNSSRFKLLKRAFANGPSHAVLKHGKVLVYEDSELLASADDSDNKPESDSQPESDKPKSDNNALIRAHYSILEAYLNTNHKIYEADEDTKSADQLPNFKPGTNLYVNVLLPGEGCTLWHLVLNESIKNKVAAIKDALKAKKFKSAIALANKDSKSGNIFVVSGKTYINRNADCCVPYMGNCQYGFDAGEDDDNEANSICIAVAPLSPVNNKPNKSTVYKVTYKINEDITDGELDKMSNAQSDDEDDSEEEHLSKYLHNKFKCAGNNTMYNDFIKIRNFVKENLMSGKLELDSQESETPLRYAMIAEVKKTLICY